METVLSGMISNLALPPPPPPQPQQETPTELSSVHHHPQLETAGTPTPPNSSTSTSTSLVVRTPSATSPATNSPGAFNAGHQHMAISPSGSSQSIFQQAVDNQQQPQQQQQPRTNRTFFRPPGLGPEGVDGGGEPFPTNAMVCPHCGFCCSSKFHYNSHMNTHNIQRCSMCNYQSRTEGRLKKHMQQSHTHEDRVAAGICISPPPPPAAALPMPQGQNSPNDVGNGEERVRGDANNGAIPTSIGPFLNSMLTDTPPNGSALSSLESLQSMLNNTNPLAQFSNSDALLKICTDAIANNGPNEKAYNSPQMGDLGPTALDHLRALAERQAANLLATSTANALGFVGNMQIGQHDEVLMGGPHENGIKDDSADNNKPDAPRRSGKPKQYKCKQCPHISRSKKEQWAHARLHIPQQKQLTCQLCDFVTEYKHHLEYHYRNHNGQKPFKCSTCAYTCVNKSMLNSHMKSHTPVYQFRCQDCTYQTKYCHSLKMHLKKYNHKRAPGPGGSDSSDSHGEERPENASSSSVGKDESFENGAPSQSQSGGEMAEGNELAVMHSSVVGHHHHHALLMAQPMMDAEMEMASQRFLLEQQLQLEQMNELIRNAVVNCPHCNFSTGNIDEMNRHLLFHLIATQQQLPPLNNEQQALASIYQRLTAQLQQELAIEGPIQQDPSYLLSQALAGGHTAQEVPMEFDKARHVEREVAADGIRQQHHNTESTENFTTPVTTAASLHDTVERRRQMPEGIEETGSNQIAGTSSGVGTSNMKREFQQQQHQHFHHFQKPMALGENEGRERMASGTCVVKNVMGLPLMLPGFSNGFPQSSAADGGAGTTNGFAPNLLNTISNANNENASNLPFFCQQCEIAFKDAVLYQLHRGYHSIESPFKCNRCGHLSGSALEFNLHLYQAKHE